MVHGGPRPGAHAPIGVMADHRHGAGEFMLSYRFMRMGMEGSLDGDDHVSGAGVISASGENFLVSPTSMEMDMHMFGLMYAPTDRITLMAMVPYVLSRMEHRTRAGAKFTTHGEGVGDVSLTALVGLFERGAHRVYANLGIGFPTGRIDARGRNPLSGGDHVRLPYPMQIGSGTFDFLPGLTYTGHDGILDWGAQARGVVRLEENDSEYALGNRYAVTGWLAGEVFSAMSVSARLEWQQWMNVNGRDPSFEMAFRNRVIPTADPGRRAGQRLDALFGVNFVVTGGALKGVRVAVEAGLPAYQSLDGPQLETDYLLTTGLQYAF